MFRTVNTEVAVTGELGDAMRAADRVRAVFEGNTAVLAGRVANSGDWSFDGCASPTAWCLAYTGLSAGRARTEIGRGRALQDCPHVTEFAQAGRLSRCKVDLMLDIRRPEVLDLFLEDEAKLCAEIEPLRTAAAKDHLQDWYHQALERLRINEPDDFVPPSPRSEFQLTPTIDGRHIPRGDFDAEGSAVLRKSIEDLIAAWRRDGILTPEDERSWKELQADALVELVSRGAGHANPRAASLIALIDVDTLVGRAPDAASMGFTSTLAGQGAIHPDTLRRLACNADLHPIFHRGGHEILDVGRKQRIATDAIRRAVYARSGGTCELCHNTRLTWCQVHHIEWWERGGDTSLANSLLVCNHCHHLLHEGRHTVRRTDGGFQLVKPDGTLPRPPNRHRVPHDP